jgi:hypothetical protein
VASPTATCTGEAAGAMGIQESSGKAPKGKRGKTNSQEGLAKNNKTVELTSSQIASPSFPSIGVRTCGRNHRDNHRNKEDNRVA